MIEWRVDGSTDESDEDARRVDWWMEEWTDGLDGWMD